MKNMESFFQSQAVKPEEPKEEKLKKNKPSGKIGGWIKRNAALVAAVGVGYLGGSHEAIIGGAPKTEKNVRPKLEHRESKAGSIIESTDSFDVLHRDKKSTWGVEYVQKQNKDGEYFAQRYVKIDNQTGESTVLGEYDNAFQVAEGVAKIAGVPGEVLKHAQRDAGIIKTERDFQGSGFTEPTGSAKGKTHVEERTFEGYNIKAKNTVEVDEKGRVVRLIDSERLESEK